MDELNCRMQKTEEQLNELENRREYKSPNLKNKVDS